MSSQGATWALPKMTFIKQFMNLLCKKQSPVLNDHFSCVARVAVYNRFYSIVDQNRHYLKKLSQ